MALEKEEDEMKLITMLVFVLMLLAGANVFAQGSMRALEAQFVKIDSAVSVLNNKKNILNEPLQQKAVQIQELKNKNELNYFQHQKLEGLLKDSQDLSNRMADFDSDLRKVKQRLVKTGNELLTIYDSEIKKSLKNLATKDLAQEYRQTILQNIEILRRKKENIKSRIGPETAIEIRMSQLKIEPDDTPKRIKQKADLLKDQEDKFRRLASRLNSRKEELTKELNLRNRIHDLVTDLALFDQQEEILGNLSTSEGGSRLASADASNPDDEISQGLRASESNFIFVGQKDFNFSTLSTEQFEEFIESLIEQEKQAEIKADSLGQRAETFYKAVKRFKKQ